MTRATAQAEARRSLLRECGFTLVETMMAVTVLLVGVLGVVAMADGASRATAGAQARDNGINLARRVIETTNSLAYTDVTRDGWSRSCRRSRGWLTPGRPRAGR